MQLGSEMLQRMAARVPLERATGLTPIAAHVLSCTCRIKNARFRWRMRRAEMLLLLTGGGDGCGPHAGKVETRWTTRVFG
jgi:hypothetical protein